MPLFPDQNLCFIHIPKTGGQSIETHFFEKEKPILGIKDELYIEKYMMNHIWNFDPSNIRFSYQHFTYDDLKNKISDIDNYRIFTVIRNPYDRIASEFHYRTNFSRNEVHLKVKFADFVRSFLQEGVNNLMDNHQLPQYKFIENCSNIQIIRFETLNEDFNRLFKEQLKCKIGASSRRDFNEYYTIKVKEMVKEFYKRDFEMFGYPMELD